MSILKLAVRFLPVLLAVSLLPAQQRIQTTNLADANQQVQFNIHLPIQNSAQLDQLLVDLHDSSSPKYRHWLTPAQFRQQFGPKQADVAKITADLTARGIKVTATHSHGLTVQGKIGAVQGLLGVPLYNGQTAEGVKKIVAKQQFTLPAAYTAAGAKIMAFGQTIHMAPHHQSIGQVQVPANMFSTTGGYFPEDLKQAYDFPSYKSLNGAGRKIAILMSCDYSNTDMSQFFGYLGRPVPNIVRVTVNGGAPYNPNSGACFENALDLQQAGGMAPGATIYDVNIPSLSNDDVFDGYLVIVEFNLADVVNSSFGGAEGFYTAPYNGGEDFTWMIAELDDLFRQGNAQGITFVASSGDSGGLALPSVGYFDPPKKPPVVSAVFLPGVQQPASCPHVTAVGGTNLVTVHKSGSRDSTYVKENAYYDPEYPYDPYGVGNGVSGGVWQGGGGVSVIFHKPSYQNLVYTGFNMRTVPDLAFQMGGCPGGILIGPCPAERSYVYERFAGGWWGAIGTSAGAPAITGVVALQDQLLRTRVGNFNNLIYYMANWQYQGMRQAFHMGIPGDNGVFKSPFNYAIYNLVLGNGTPFVRSLIGAGGLPAAGIPGTATNP